MKNIIWVVGQMCSGKTTFSKKFGKLIGKEPFHLDHIRQDINLVQAYAEAVQSGLVEGYTPHRNQQHLEAITEALRGHTVSYILIAPSYKQWKKNCLPIIACPTDENPPDYTEEQYEAENERLKQLTNPILCLS